MGGSGAQMQVGAKEVIDVGEFEEVYTSSNWLARIYRLKPPGNRG